MKSLLFTMAIVGTTIFANAQDIPIPLYPSNIPNSKPTPATYIEKTVTQGSDTWVSVVSIPTLTLFFPAKGTANGTAVVICPGGGYSGLSMNKEGYAVAKEFNKIGVTAFVLKYRLPSDDIMVDKTIGPLQDAQQAIYTVRKRAAEWGLKPPITFLVHAQDDNVVPIQNSLMFYESMLQNKVKGALHVYQAGGHGFGLYNPKNRNLWFDWCKAWLDENGLL
jgi:acetyl esterase/lipase